MINTINHNINIDLINKINMNKSINIKQNDTNSHKFVINIFNNSLRYDLTGLTAKIYFLKADSTKIFQDCTLDDAINGKMNCILSTQTLSFAGIVSAEITIYGTSGEVLTSITFDFNVTKVLRDDIAIESTSEFTALTTTLNSIEAALISVPTIEALKIALEGDITTGNALDITLKADISTGNTTDTNIKASTIIGDATDAALKADIIIAGQNEFATEITNARGGEINLDTRLDKVDTSLADNVTQLGLKMKKGELFISVKDYGAVGDGIVNDSVAFANASIASNGGAIYFPKGTYDLSAMTPIGGKILLLSFENAIIKGFNYKELNAPLHTYQSTNSENDAFFRAEGITFEGNGVIPGLTITNQSQGGVIRSFALRSCIFRGLIGLVTNNCLTSTLDNCDFIQNQYGWKALSCTNLVVTNCQFITPIYGVYIDKSATDTSSRLGGENIKFQGCTWIDGVTAIWAKCHNYLWLSSCLQDYFNCGMYLQGCKFARFDNIYIGCNDSNRTGRSDYIAPTQFGALYGCGDSASSRSTGVEATNSEFVAYGTSTRTPVKLDGSTVAFTGIEEVDFDTCRFASDNTVNTNSYLLQIIKANEVYHSGNKYFSSLNNGLIAPWVFTTMAQGRIFSERNNYKNCTNSVGTVIPPSTGVVGNEIYESAQITVVTNGTSTSSAVAYTYKNKYVNLPRVVATVRSAVIPAEKLNVGLDAQDLNLIFIKVSHIDGTVMASASNIIVDLIIMGE